MARRDNPSDLYLRWFLIVYLPLGLLAMELILLPFDILPGWTIWPLLVLALYAIPAVRLLIERKKSGLGTPLPRRMIVFAGVLGGMLALGVGLFVVGMGNLTSSRGLTMVYVGGCLMILSVTAPVFRLVDIVFRKAGRSFRRLLVPSGGTSLSGEAPMTTGRRQRPGNSKKTTARNPANRPEGFRPGVRRQSPLRYSGGRKPAGRPGR